MTTEPPTSCEDLCIERCVGTCDGGSVEEARDVLAHTVVDLRAENERMRMEALNADDGRSYYMARTAHWMERARTAEARLAVLTEAAEKVVTVPAGGMQLVEARNALAVALNQPEGDE